MPRIVVQVMPKQELLDPAGKAVQRALAASGHGHIDSVRIGQRFEIVTERPVSAELMAEVAAIADDLLSNGVIEDVISIEVADEPGSDDPAGEFLATGASNDAQAELNERCA